MKKSKTTKRKERGGSSGAAPWLGIKVVKPKDRMPDEILGVLTPKMNANRYVQQLERYYGFPCGVFDA